MSAVGRHTTWRNFFVKLKRDFPCHFCLQPNNDEAVAQVLGGGGARAEGGKERRREGSEKRSSKKKDKEVSNWIYFSEVKGHCLWKA